MSETITPLAYSIRGAVRASGLARSRLYDLMEKGDISAFKIGRRTMIRADSLAAFIASLPPARIGTGRHARTTAA